MKQFVVCFRRFRGGEGAGGNAVELGFFTEDAIEQGRADHVEVAVDVIFGDIPFIAPEEDNFRPIDLPGRKFGHQFIKPFWSRTTRQSDDTATVVGHGFVISFDKPVARSNSSRFGVGRDNSFDGGCHEGIVARVERSVQGTRTEIHYHQGQKPGNTLSKFEKKPAMRLESAV